MARRFQCVSFPRCDPRNSIRLRSISMARLEYRFAHSRAAVFRPWVGLRSSTAVIADALHRRAIRRRRTCCPIRIHQTCSQPLKSTRHVERSETCGHHLLMFVHKYSEILRFSEEQATLCYFGTTATKSRTGFRPGIENTLPSLRANQKALEEPPSRFIARRIFESAAMGTVARMSANPESDTSEQNPSKARSLVASPAKVRRASCESFNPRMRLFASTRNRPD